MKEQQSKLMTLKNIVQYRKSYPPAWNKGMKFPELSAKMMGHESFFTHPMTEEQCKNISIAKTGTQYSEKSKQRCSNSALNRPEITCPYCGKVGDISAMKHWHFDYCKNNPNRKELAAVSSESKKSMSDGYHKNLKKYQCPLCGKALRTCHFIWHVLHKCLKLL